MWRRSKGQGVTEGGAGRECLDRVLCQNAGEIFKELDPPPSRQPEGGASRESPKPEDVLSSLQERRPAAHATELSRIGLVLKRKGETIFGRKLCNNMGVVNPRGAHYAPFIRDGAFQNSLYSNEKKKN
ncbi:hypothetical protein EYF80_039671 [Liparis tanakae]|uniref:Uncharacterized protein n=1 Tax=Liparis tanakae TaxID=230148 RepID=A0A4Z2G9A2_9TELE|nr:hypothetical protein EYF80_039671 [Liparis tanakae]